MHVERSRGDPWEGLTRGEVALIASRLLVVAEARLEAGLFGPVLDYAVRDLQELVIDYPEFLSSDFTESFEIVLQAWRDRPGA